MGSLELAWRSVPTSRKRGAGAARMIRVLDVRTVRWKWVRLSSLNATELRAAAARNGARKVRPSGATRNRPGTAAKNLSWREPGRRILAIGKLHPKLAAIARAANKKKIGWIAHALIEADKYGAKKQIGTMVWIPAKGVLAQDQHGKAYFSRTSQMARTAYEAIRASHALHDLRWMRKGAAGMLSSPTFAHYLYAREAAEREGRKMPAASDWWGGEEWHPQSQSAFLRRQQLQHPKYYREKALHPEPNQAALRNPLDPAEAQFQLRYANGWFRAAQENIAVSQPADALDWAARASAHAHLIESLTRKTAPVQNGLAKRIAAKASGLVEYAKEWLKFSRRPKRFQTTRQAIHKAYSRPGINRRNPPGGGMVRGDGRIRWLSDVVAKATPRGRFWMFLSSFPNPDYGETRAPAKPVLVWADTLQELRKKVEVYRDENGLGGGNWRGAIFGSGRTIFGHFSYNGRAWEGLPWEGYGPEIIIGGSVGRNGVVGRPDPLPWGALSQIEKTEIRKQWAQYGYDDQWFASRGWIKRYGLWETRWVASRGWIMRDGLWEHRSASKNRRTR